MHDPVVERWQEEALPRWLAEAKQSGIAEFQSLAASILQNFDAVQAALRLPHSNGLVEGKVNKLKSLKRQMYGRANFELLRKRLLRGVIASSDLRCASAKLMAA